MSRLARLSIMVGAAFAAFGGAPVGPLDAPRQRTRSVPPKPDHEAHIRRAEEKRQMRAEKKRKIAQRP